MFFVIHVPESQATRVHCSSFIVAPREDTAWCRTVVSIVNLPAEWQTEAELTAALEAFDTTVVRCGIITNPAAASKGLAIVEFALPTQASRAVAGVRLIREVCAQPQVVGRSQESCGAR